jgi:cobalt-zinc-cadmium efflux system protein
MSAGHHHHHDHHAGHDHDHGVRSRRALLLSLGLNSAFLVIEGSVGWWTGSLALLSDAAHMVADVSALMLAYAVSLLATRPATGTRTFGLARAESLGAFINGAALLVICGVIFHEAVSRLVEGPPPVPGWPVLWVGLVGLLINLGSAWLLWRSASDDLNVRGALMHMLADALGSAGAMVAAAFTLVFGWYAADSVVSLFVGALVLWGAVHLVRASTRVLLDFAPTGLDAEDLAERLCALETVQAVHDLHVWGQGRSRSTVTAHITPTADADPFEVLRACEAVLNDDFGVRHSTLQIDSPGGDCAQLQCPLAAPLPAGGHSHAH